MPTKHAKLSCSSSHRWINCAASPSFIDSLNLPSTSSSYANEGTAAHTLHENILQTMVCDVKSKPIDIGDKITVEKEIFTVSEEMLRCVKTSTNYIFNRYSTCGFDDQEATLDIEQWVSLDQYKIKGLDGGTADAILIFRDIESGIVNEIEVIDYKHGRVEVSPKDNTQLMMYAVAAVDDTHSPDVSNLKIKLTIVQPRAGSGSIKTHEISHKDLATWKNYTLIPSAEATLVKNPTFTPSQSACKWCPALAHCNAAAKKVQMVAQREFSKPVSTCNVHINELSTADKKAIFEHSDFVKSFFDAVNAHIQSEMVNGDESYDDVAKLVRKKTNAKFKDDAFDEFLSPLFDILDANETRKTVHKNITEIKKLLLNEISVDECKNIMQNVTYREDGELIAVLLSDKREPIKVLKN